MLVICQMTTLMLVHLFTRGLDCASLGDNHKRMVTQYLGRHMCKLIATEFIVQFHIMDGLNTLFFLSSSDPINLNLEFRILYGMANAITLQNKKTNKNTGTVMGMRLLMSRLNSSQGRMFERSRPNRDS